MYLKSGTYLKFESYLIEKVLGYGGFGVTYLAFQVGLNRRVAIKEFYLEEYLYRDNNSNELIAKSDEAKQLVAKYKNKFIKEAQLIAEMDNPHVVPVYDVFEENRTAYYVMKYIEGGSLDDLVQEKGAIDETEAVFYIKQVAEALTYVHSRNILHLDIKPSNILLHNNVAILIDFGISKHYDEGGKETTTLLAGISRGYAPIEQYNRNLQYFTPATDVYALGATMYYLITGEDPPEALVVHEEGVYAFPLHCSITVKEAIKSAMVSNRRYRLQSVPEFIALLEANSTFDTTIKQIKNKHTDAPRKIFVGLVSGLTLFLICLIIPIVIFRCNLQEVENNDEFIEKYTEKEVDDVENSKSMIDSKIKNSSNSYVKLLHSSNIRMQCGDLTYIKYEVFPPDTDAKRLIWHSSDTSIVSVVGDGLIQAKQKGVSKVTITLGNESVVCTVIVNDSKLVGTDKEDSKNTRQMYLSSTMETIKVGESVQLRAFNSEKTIRWSSDNSKVASVSSNGLVSGKSIGTVRIWAIGSEYKWCSITVLPIDPSHVMDKAQPGKINLDLGESIKLEYYGRETRRWETDNKDVVIVNSAGVATAVGVGSTNVWGYFDGFPKRYFIVVEK